MRSSIGVWACVLAALAACTAFTVRAQSRPSGISEGGVTTVPSFNTDPAVSKVKFELDLSSTSFSLQNAFYFARMSKIVYAPKLEVEGLLKGNATSPGMGFDRFHWFEADPAVSGESVLDAIHDTEAFVAANDDLLLVVFRGTKELTDWTTNLNIGLRSVPEEWGVEDGCDLHRGFDDGVNTVWLPHSPSGMHQTIRRLYDEEGKSRKLFIAGHSLGGALATIAAARLAFVDNMNIAAMYTIGSPKVFDGKMAAIFDAKMNYGTPMKDKYFRCRNNNDIVPRVPPTPYQHVGREIYLDRFGTITHTSFGDRLLGRASALFRGGTFIDGINDHASSEYCRLFEQAIIAARLSLLDKTKSVVKDAVQTVIPVNTSEKKAKQHEIKAAKEAALEASKVTANPAINLNSMVEACKDDRKMSKSSDQTCRVSD